MAMTLFTNGAKRPVSGPDLHERRLPYPEDDLAAMADSRYRRRSEGRRLFLGSTVLRVTASEELSAFRRLLPCFSNRLSVKSVSEKKQFVI
jgi:hypothetical protein